MLWKKLILIILIVTIHLSVPVTAMAFTVIPAVQPQRHSYTTTTDILITATPDFAALSPPTGFTITDLGAVSITANWTPSGDPAAYTMVRISRTGYPTTTSEGELYYYGDASSANGTGYELVSTTYYASAWGFLADNTTSSSEYVTATIGGSELLYLVLALLVIGFSAAMFVSKQSMLGFPSTITCFLLGGYGFLQSSATWDIHYFIGFSFIWIGVGMALAASGLRTKKEDIQIGDEFYDEGAKDSDIKYIDEIPGIDEELRELSPWRREVREQADRRRRSVRATATRRRVDYGEFS